mgnify:CR=1 FL=1
MGPTRQQIQIAYKGEELEARIKKAYEESLNAIVDRYLILDSYSKLEQKLPEWVIEDRVSEIIHESFKGERTEFMSSLAKNKMTYDEWHDQVRDHIIVSAMRNERIDRHVRVSPKAVRQAYESNPERYRPPDKVSLRLIMLKRGSTADETAATRQQAEAAEGLASFKEKRKPGWYPAAA